MDIMVISFIRIFQVAENLPPPFKISFKLIKIN